MHWDRTVQVQHSQGCCILGGDVRQWRSAVLHVGSVAARDSGFDVEDGHHGTADCDRCAADHQHECRKLGPREQGPVFQLEVRGRWEDVGQRYGGQDALEGKR